MNKITIIGNLTGEPELRTTPGGKSVCNFTVAVNRRKKVEGQPDADFFRVSAWNQLGENCAKFLMKGKKVCVIGSISVRAYETQKHEPGASMEIMAQEIEFLSPRPSDVDSSGMTKVEPDDLPFDVSQGGLPY